MKRLGLLRHAKSEWDDAVTRDFDRGLNDRGRRGAALIGQHINAQGVGWDAMIASPAVRVKETLEAAQLNCDPRFEPRLYLASPETILDLLGSQGGDGNDESEPSSILIAAHNPGLQQTILELVAPARENDLFREAVIKFPTSTFAVLDCAIDSWSAIRPRCAELTHLARPRDLDPSLGPEF